MEGASSEISEGETSDDGLKLVIDSPKRKSPKKPKAEINFAEKQMIESIEKQLEDTLSEKAAKSNLTTINVKNILKQVVTNEHVIALVRQTENPETAGEPHFQPKLTRAKTKELFSSAPPVSSLPWVSQTKPSSEVQKLISDELAEDSSGDEYVPAEEESEDDRDSYVLSESEIRSISPPTPAKEPESPREVHWTDDGIFKIPPAKSKEEEEANIALRTRSKLSLSATPLEIIEEAFIPPDITTDMYDMDMEDDVWCDFLKKFTRPLDEITREDEDHDPEYNILADEEVDEVDTEELRADKAVKVSRKELNDMLAELYEYASKFTENLDESTPTIDVSAEPQVSILDNSSIMDTSLQSETQDTKNIRTPITHVVDPIEPASEATFNDIMRMDQKLLLEQQMREHVQMLTQNFLLSFQHPEFHDISLKLKENLIILKLLSEDKENSMFKACNLYNALKLVENWEKQFELNTDEVKAMKQYVCKVLQESKQRHTAGIDYIATFPPLILETISKSDVFIYPDLLPRIPFKSASLFKKHTTYTKSEDELITFGLDQFIPCLAQDKYHLTHNGEVKLKSVCAMITRYMMPMKDVTKLYCHIFNSKNPRSSENPIKSYFQNKKLSVMLHYVRSLDEFGILPPCKRSQELLPHQWKEYLYPELDADKNSATSAPAVVPACITKVAKPPAFNKALSRTPPKRRLVPKSSVHPSARRNLNTTFNKRTNLSISPFANTRGKGIFSSTPYKAVSPTLITKKLEQYFKSPKVPSLQKNLNPCVRCMKFNSSIFNKLRNRKVDAADLDTMLPSMPFLGSSCTNDSITDNSSFSEVPSVTSASVKDTSAELNNEKTVEADSTIIDAEEEEVVEKDNEEDINALMIASSTIKNLAKRGPSGHEKKKAKQRREYSATLAMLSPEDPAVLQEKAQSYAQAYFDKAHERLNQQDYQRFMEILNDFNEGTNSVSDLYKQMENILHDHKDLMDEFLTFLTPAQAKDIGKLIPYYMLSNMSLFLRKLEIYFKEQPAQLRRIYRSLTDLSTCVNVNMDRVKNTILPLLKGNNLLTDWFLQIFPCEPPPESLLKGPWENMDVRRDISSAENVYETITLPEADDPYGGPNCACSCHQGEDLVYKSRLQHCVPCGIKFLQGRVYIQTGKGIRLANVTFNANSDIDHNARLNCSSLDRRKRRSEVSPSKHLTSPAKDCQEEVRAANDSEDDECSKKKSRVSKSPRKKRVRITEKAGKASNVKTENEQAEVLLESCDKSSKVPNSINNVENVKMEQEQEPEPTNEISTTVVEDCDNNLVKPASEEVAEWDCNTSIESTELKQSPEHSAESESEFCEESSQDNINTETDESAEEIESLSNSPVHSDNSNSNTFEEISWTRDEDKTILETLQKEGDKEEAFVRISEVLGNRTVSQIKERFHTLMSLLQKMTSCKDACF